MFNYQQIKKICENYNISKEELLDSKNHIVIKANKEDIATGDTILVNGVQTTVSDKSIKKGTFMGTTIIGDSYKLGNDMVEKVIFKAELARQTNSELVEINKENIADYYEFMNKTDKNKNARLISEVLFERLYSKEFDTFIRDIPMEVLLKNSDDTAFKDLLVETSYFSIKDTLKPIDEYIAEIKESEGYKEYLKSTLTPKERLALEVNEWIDEVDKAIGNEKSFHLREQGLFTMQQVGSDRVQIRNPKENKEITFNISTTIDKALIRDIGRILEIKDLTLVGLNNNQELKKSEIEKIHQKIQNNEVIPPSEYSKIDLESEAFKSLDSETQTTITDYINEQSDKIVNAALEEEKLKQERNSSIAPSA